MKNKRTQHSLLYKNSDSLFKKQALVFILCFIAILFSTTTTITIFKYTKSFLEEPSGYYQILGCVVIFLVASWFFIKSLIHIIEFRNIEIDDEGIHKYWISPNLAYQFIPFKEIATCYITEVDFEKIYKWKKKSIVPIVFDAEMNGAYSKIYPNGNDLVIITHKYQTITLLNLDDATEVYRNIKASIYNCNLAEDNLEKISEIDSEKSATINATTSTTKDNSENYLNQGNSVNNSISSNSDNTDTISNTKRTKEKVLTEIKVGVPVVLYLGIVTHAIALPHLATMYIPISYSTIFTLNIITLLLAIFIFFLFKPIKVQITTKRINVFGGDKKLKYTCLASNLKFPQIVYYRHGKTDGYYIEIISKNNDNYNICDMKARYFKKYVESINYMMLTEAKIIK